MALKVGLFTVRPGPSDAGPMAKLSAEYLRRCGRSFSAEMRTFRTEEALLQHVAEERRKGAAALWIADPGGAAFSSEAFAGRIRQDRENGLRHLVIAVGPANGWSQSARAYAQVRLGLGAMTLPHELAALVLAEQIYRASTILEGHPYHLGH